MRGSAKVKSVKKDHREKDKVELTSQEKGRGRGS